MIRGSHLAFRTIVDLVEERLKGAERAAAQAHLASCDRCAQELRSVAGLLSTMRDDTSEDAPRAVVARATELFRRRQPEPQPSLLRRIIAAVSFDSAGLQPQFGLRAAATSVRQVLYSAGDYDIDLHLQTTGTDWTIAGQILGECTGGEVELRGSAQSVSTSLNPMCEFKLEPVSPGNYSLFVHLADVELEVSDLSLGSEHAAD